MEGEGLCVVTTYGVGFFRWECRLDFFEEDCFVVRLCLLMDDMHPREGRGAYGPVTSSSVGGIRWSFVQGVGDCPAPCGGAVSFVYKGEMYVFGGMMNRGFSNMLHKFSPRNRSWQVVPYLSNIDLSCPPPCGRASASGVVLGDKLFIFGGSDGTKLLNDLHIFHLEKKRWIPFETKGSPPSPRSRQGSFVTGRTVFITGGCCSEPYSKAAPTFSFHLTIDRGQWTVNWKQHTRFHPSANPHVPIFIPQKDLLYLVAKEGIYCTNVAGILGTGCEQMCPLEKCCSFPKRDGYVAVGSSSGDVLIHGGQKADDILHYDVSATEPSQVCLDRKDIAGSRSGHVGEVIDGILWVFGGRVGEEQRYRDDLQRYELSEHLLWNEEDTPLTRFANDMYKFLGSHDFADVVLVCDDGEKIPAHRVILAARSPHFNAMFTSTMLESCSNEIHLTEVTGPVLRVFLKYLYTSMLNVDLSLAFDLYKLADYHGIDTLSTQISTFVCGQVTEDNVLSVLLDAYRHRVKAVQHHCIHVLGQSFQNFITTEQFATLPDPLQHDIFKAVSKKIRVQQISADDN